MIYFSKFWKFYKLLFFFIIQLRQGMEEEGNNNDKIGGFFQNPNNPRRRRSSIGWKRRERHSWRRIKFTLGKFINITGSAAFWNFIQHVIILGGK